MPYIKEEDKKRLDYENPETVGELTYVFCVIADDYIAKKGKNYATLAEVHAALGNSDKEIYRRITAPYEDKKIKENGEVFTQAEDCACRQPNLPATHRRLPELCYYPPRPLTDEELKSGTVND